MTEQATQTAPELIVAEIYVRALAGTLGTPLTIDDYQVTPLAHGDPSRGIAGYTPRGSRIIVFMDDIQSGLIRYDTYLGRREPATEAERDELFRIMSTDKSIQAFIRTLHDAARKNGLVDRLGSDVITQNPPTFFTAASSFTDRDQKLWQFAEKYIKPVHEFEQLYFGK